MLEIRINELARELEVPSRAIIELLPDLGVDEKKTHSSSVDPEVAEKIRLHFQSRSRPGLPFDLTSPRPAPPLPKPPIRPPVPAIPVPTRAQAPVRPPLPGDAPRIPIPKPAAPPASASGPIPGAPLPPWPSSVSAPQIPVPPRPGMILNRPRAPIFPSPPWPTAPESKPWTLRAKQDAVAFAGVPELQLDAFLDAHIPFAWRPSGQIWPELLPALQILSKGATYPGDLHVFAVAQAPPSGGGPVLLSPIARLDGTAVSREDFPNRGFVTCQYSPVEEDDAIWVPGQLVVGQVELRPQWSPSSPNASKFRVVVGTLRRPFPYELAQVFAEEDLEAFETHGFRQRGLAAPPANVALVKRKDGSLSGPYDVATLASGGRHYAFLRPLGEAGPVVTPDDQSDLQSLCPTFKIEISQTAKAPYNETTGLANYEIRLALGSNVKTLLDASATRSSALEAVIAEAARDLGQALEAGVWARRLLDVEKQGRASAPSLETITKNRATLERRAREADELAARIYDSGILDQQFQRLMEDQLKATREIIQEKAESLARNQVELIREGLEREISAATGEITSRVQSILAGLEAKRQPLDDIKIALARVGASPTEAAAESSTTLASPAPALGWPTIAKPQRRALVTEGAFFERFVTHVAARGFDYDQRQLEAFHLHLKVSDFTILSGLSGTGKSSLPLLYAEALAGETRENGSLPPFLHRLTVNPNWTEYLDLFGRPNGLKHTFVSAESRLYEFLVESNREADQLGEHASPRLIVLDEMNLAAVENYLSPILEQLAKPASEVREFPVFNPTTVLPTDRFRDFATIRLPSSLRFIGTVNYDETTKRLSMRVLDRAGEMSILGPKSPKWPPTVVRQAAGSGTQITLRDMAAWPRTPELFTKTHNDTLESLGMQLSLLGVPLNPRRLAAVRELVIASSVLSVERAFDIAVAQRVLPLLRTELFRLQSGSALDGLEKALRDAGFQDNSLSLEVLATLRNFN